MPRTARFPGASPSPTSPPGHRTSTPSRAHTRRRGRRCHPYRTGVEPELGGSVFPSSGGTYQLTWGGHRGDRVGLYTYNPSSTPSRPPGSTRASACATARSPTSTVRRTRMGRRHPVARHRRVEPAVGLPVHRDGGGYHTIACVRSGKVLDKAVLGGGGRGGRTDDRRRPDEPAVAAAPAGRGRVRPGRPQQGVNDQAIALSSSKGARCLPSSADGACCK
jgi:hypothetical protein